MCGIAGILFKHNEARNFNLSTGTALTEIMDATLHRGSDSAGWAIYKPPIQDTLRMRFIIPEDETEQNEVAKIKSLLTEHEVSVLEIERLGCTIGIQAKFDGDILALTRAVEQELKPVSIGSSLDILKDVGQPKTLAPEYKIDEFNGTHGIGHI